MKVSEQVSATVEGTVQPKQNIGGKLVSTSAMQVDTQAVSDSPVQVELKETTQNLSQMMSQGNKKRTLDEHQEGLQDGEEQGEEEAASEEEE